MKNIEITSREQLQLARLYAENGEGVQYVYTESATTFQILRKYRDEAHEGEKGQKTLFDIAIIDGSDRKEYNGKDATTLAKVITGESKGVSRTRKAKALTPAEKADKLRAEWDAIRERAQEIAEEIGAKLPKLPKADKLDFSEYIAKLERAEREEEMQNTAKKFTKAELLAMLEMCEE